MIAFWNFCQDFSLPGTGCTRQRVNWSVLNLTVDYNYLHYCLKWYSLPGGKFLGLMEDLMIEATMIATRADKMIRVVSILTPPGSRTHCWCLMSGSYHTWGQVRHSGRDISCFFSMWGGQRFCKLCRVTPNLYNLYQQLLLLSCLLGVVKIVYFSSLSRKTPGKTRILNNQQ